MDEKLAKHVLIHGVANSPAGAGVAAEHVRQRGKGAGLAGGLAGLGVLRAQPHQRRRCIGMRRAWQPPAHCSSCCVSAELFAASNHVSVTAPLACLEHGRPLRMCNDRSDSSQRSGRTVL